LIEPKDNSYSVTITREDSYIGCRLAKLGYFSGDPSKVLDAPVDVVCDIMAVENVQNQIEQHHMRQAKEKHT